MEIFVIVVLLILLILFGAISLSHGIRLRKEFDSKGTLPDRFFGFTKEAMIITDEKADIIQVNDAFVEMSGYAVTELIGKNPRIMQSGRHDEEFYRGMWKSLLKSGHWRGEIWNRRRDGSLYPCWLSISSLEDDSGNVTNYVGLAMDISKLKQNERRLEQMAHFDMLTNLPNRLLLSDRISQAASVARRHGQSVALMMLDLDGFKEVNDTLGHYIGDQLLMEVAYRLKGIIRESDTVSRLGGDEFMVIFPDIRNYDKAAHAAQRLLDTVAKPFKLGGHDIYITTSIGITMYPNDSSNIDELFKNADTAMYHAKSQGKNNFQFFNKEMSRQALERLILGTGLRRAIENRDLVLKYQPMVDANTGQLIGMEALVRWKHPEHGVISPSKFIQLAEDMGLIIALEEWVLQEACRQNKTWQDDGLSPVRVSVNMSARHFQHQKLVNSIADILDETGLNPKFLMLEITERVIVRDAEETIQTMAKLKGMGLSISIDDFGTGYSSLSYLSRFPIDELKIDRSFVRNIHADSGNSAVIEAIIALAHGMALDVVAEGVETAKQLDFLREKGCRGLQGFYFSRAVSSEEMRKLLEKGFRFSVALD